MNHSHHYTEKLFYGMSSLAASTVSLLGAILTQDDQKWIYVTLSAGIMVSACMGLMTRRNESMRIVAGRGLFSIICTVLGTRLLVHWLNVLAIAKDDVLILGGVSACVCVMAFTVGFGFIRGLDQEKFSLGKALKDLLILILTKK